MTYYTLPPDNNVVITPPGYIIGAPPVDRSVVFADQFGDAAIKIDFGHDPITVWVRKDLSVDQAGKLLLNSMAALVGSPKPFPETKP